MAKEKILTVEQERVLDLFSNEDYLTRKFYFTGGTALSAFYLFHRISEDLDFFSEQEIHLPSIEKFIGKLKKSLNLTGLTHFEKIACLQCNQPFGN